MGMKRLPNLLIFSGITALLIISCNPNPKPQKPVAVVHDKYLYQSDLNNLFLDNVTKEDSALIAKAYIEKWIQTQLLLRMAEKNLTDSQKNVARQLEDYRASLLIFKYEQAYVNQKLDTAVNLNELKSYYEENKDNFLLQETMVKALYIKLRKEAPQAEKIRKLYRSTKDEDIKQLDNLAYQAALKYDYFNDQWVPLSLIIAKLPNQPDRNPEREIIRNKYIEIDEGDFTYLVSFRDILPKGTIAPFETVITDLKSILINSRKQKLIETLEQNIYNNALNKGTFKIFDNQTR